MTHKKLRTRLAREMRTWMNEHGFKMALPESVRLIKELKTTTLTAVLQGLGFSVHHNYVNMACAGSEEPEWENVLELEKEGKKATLETSQYGFCWEGHWGR